jgi:hypothetical protein
MFFWRLLFLLLASFEEKKTFSFVYLVLFQVFFLTFTTFFTKQPPLEVGKKKFVFLTNSMDSGCFLFFFVLQEIIKAIYTVIAGSKILKWRN